MIYTGGTCRISTALATLVQLSRCRCPVFLRNTVEATYLPLNTGRLYSAANSIARTSTAFNL